MGVGMLPPGSLSLVRTVGADLDLTLIDSRAATTAALRRVNAELGEAVDIDVFVSRLGLPLRDELIRWMPPDRVSAAVAVFRASFLSEGLAHVSLLPGAVDLARCLRQSGGRLVVITSRIQRIAEACVEACGLDVAVIVGGCTGAAKAVPILDHQVEVYIGDHPFDMHGASVAGIPGIGITTGSHCGQQLQDAGARWVIDSLARVVEALTATPAT